MSGHPDLTPLFGPAPASAPGCGRLLRHVRACSACRARIAAEDPLRLFSLLSLDEVPAEALDRLESRLGAALDRETASTRRGNRLGLAAMAASVLLAGVLGTYLWQRSDPPAEVASTEPSETLVEPQGMELHAPEEAEVVNFVVGETRLVMIFDEGLDL